jgi:hypothetical protein
MTMRTETQMSESTHRNDPPRPQPRKPYAGPTLVKRGKLGQITGAPARTSGIVVDGAGR